MENNKLGKIREQKAINYLKKRNYEVFNSNKSLLLDYVYKIDITASKSNVIYFFQVKGINKFVFDVVWKKHLLNYMKRHECMLTSDYDDVKYGLITVPYPKKSAIHLTWLN